MKTASKMAAQGDVLFRRVRALPKGAKPVKRKRGQPIVVAHSETGHHHVVRDPGARFFTTADPFVCFLQMEAPHVDVEHLRPFDPHETVRLLGQPSGKSIFEVRRQREHTPEGWRLVSD